MAKVFARRAILSIDDGLFYVCEYGKDFVAIAHQPGKATAEEALRDYVKYLVSVAELVPLYYINIKTPAQFETLGPDNTPATHMLKIYPDRHIYLVTENFNKQAVIDKLVEDPVGIIF